MKKSYWYVLLHVGVVVTSSSFQAALDEIVAFHRQDTAALARTLDSLSTIASRLQSEPDNSRYRNIRLLNKTFWETVGSVNGGIAFMSSLGFDLLGQGADHGPCFQTRSDAPAEADLRQALDLLSARCVQLGESEKRAHPATPSAVSRSGFDPFATAFSRRSRTHLQERAQHGLVHLSQSQARQQQRFSKLEERNITILLPREKSQQPQETSGSPDREMAESEEEEEEEERELEIVAQLWRERMAHDEVERFETNAAKKLRLLRSAKVYPYVVLRVRLPGGVFLQGRFNPQETWETVYQVIGESLAVEAGYDNSDQRLRHNFELFMAPPVRVFPRDSSTSLKESNAQAPACVLHLRWESGNAQVKSWAQNLEESMSQAMGGSVYPRVPYSSRYDIPEAISSKRPQDPHHAKEGAHAAGLESGSEPGSAESPTL